MSAVSRMIRCVLRGVLMVMRSVPELICTLLFVGIFGGFNQRIFAEQSAPSCR